MEAMQELKSVLENQEPYSFSTDKITYGTVEVKGEKQHFVTGYISTSDMDIYNDLITENGLKSMLNQINESVITLDYEHEAWRDDTSILPVAKIVEAKHDERGLWVKAILNKHSPKFKALWGSVKDGFVNSFSIAFKALKTVEKVIGDSTVRLIEDLKLYNVAFTGIPVNKKATIEDYGMKSIMLKAISENEKIGEQIIVPKRLLTKFMEEKNMVEEQTPETEAPVEETPTEEPATEVETKDDTPSEETPAEETPAEEASAEVEQKSQEMLKELKAMVEKQGEENAELKSELKALKETEVFKSPTPSKPEVKSQDVNMLSLIA